MLLVRFQREAAFGTRNAPWTSTTPWRVLSRRNCCSRSSAPYASWEASGSGRTQFEVGHGLAIWSAFSATTSQFTSRFTSAPVIASAIYAPPMVSEAPIIIPNSKRM